MEMYRRGIILLMIKVYYHCFSASLTIKVLLSLRYFREAIVFCRKIFVQGETHRKSCIITRAVLRYSLLVLRSESTDCKENRKLIFHFLPGLTLQNPR